MNKNCIHLLLTVVYGIIIFMAFTPYRIGFLIPLALGGFYAILLKSSFKKAFFLGFILGTIIAGSANSWLFISFYTIHDFGFLTTFLIIILFNTYCALYFALCSCFFVKTKKEKLTIINPLMFSLYWVIFEWLKSNLLTGFPWALIGYSQIDMPIAYLASLVGVYGVGFVTIFVGCLLADGVVQYSLNRQVPLLNLILALTLYFSPYLLSYVHWTKKDKMREVQVSILQANADVKQRTNILYFNKILNFYIYNTYQSNSSLIIWPESSIPQLQEGEKFFLKMIDKLKSKKQGLILGTTIKAPENKKYNVILSLGLAQGRYLKRHLVPFGEYIPWEWLNKLFFKFSSLEYNMIPGPAYQSFIEFNGIKIASYNCYEVAFFNLIRNQLNGADLILGISNYSWLGRSFAIQQHIEIARMLSLQAGKYQIVANNNGYSAILDEQGRVINLLPNNYQGVLTVKVIPTKGTTPWTLLGDEIIILIFLVILLLSIRNKRIKDPFTA
ncbi:apolipoprotein N-acyltransferase [Legionella sp. CNM-1927-20]|uniref:apolipoprotein N-acyltransferase n=1 Tax=Legionella sp. CNM-1927-20 TaxID=3422221 RepID=UPI00403A8923